MELSVLAGRFQANHPKFSAFLKSFASQHQYYSVKGLHGSSMAFFIASFCKSHHHSVIAVMNDKEEASYLYTDLSEMIQDEEIMFFPSSFKRSARYNAVETGNIVLRTKTLEALKTPQSRHIVITYPEAIAERVVTSEHLEQNSLHIFRGEKISQSFVVDVLNEYAFERADFVFKPGQYSVRGSIIDVFSFGAFQPFRIDFFGDEVESLRTFLPDTQLSDKKLDHITLIPDLKQKIVDSKAVSFFEFAGTDTLVLVKDIKYVSQCIDDIYNNSNLIFSADEQVLGYKNLPVEKRLISSAVFHEKISLHRMIEFCNQPFLKNAPEIVFNTGLQPPFNKNFNLLIGYLSKNVENSYSNFIFSENPRQIERLGSIFNELKPGVQINYITPAIHEGFTDHDLMWCCFTDHQIFERYHKYKLFDTALQTNHQLISDLTDLHPGDYVVHTDHGIGRFAGLQKIDINGHRQEAVKLVYKDNDIVFVTIHALHRIAKYKGKEGEPPHLHKIGGAAWQNLKNNTKKKIKDIARDLIRLYARRKMEKGFAFSPESYLTRELEATFIYEDTPDQVKSTNDVKKDMEADFPMDRLICGDVGFGKTEIAIRAAFKAVADGKQVAVLVPTTILAFQHYRTFSERLKNFPCTVDYISRFRTSADIKKVLASIAEGKTDILIGTHRILGNDVKFKDLGLLVIDEEQKFGVAAKEKLRNLKVNIDTLTMTATPIPRTLQFSLLGARDLSVINTPPPNRHPIVTELHVFNPDIIREAIRFELQRNGQVFFINNRIQNINDVANLVRKVAPVARIAIGHGQMKGNELETIMLGFINGEYDVLVSTSIIESGLDIPNANTIIICDAHHFGLSDLHQLRGRVGRSNRKAFCYLLAPPLSSLPDDARRRLRAIEEFSELGSGFSIALQDLDIRGAGNMLGAEQSGFISDLGYETFQRILDEAINELKNEEFAGLYQTSEKSDHLIETSFISDCYIDTDLELLIPDTYVNSITERVKLYREIDNLADDKMMEEFIARLTDRFGPPVEQVNELLDVVRLRWLAVKLGFEKIILKNTRLVAWFVTSQNNPYYHSEIFIRIIRFLNQPQNLSMNLAEKNDKLMLSTGPVVAIHEAYLLFRQIFVHVFDSGMKNQNIKG